MSQIKKEYAQNLTGLNGFVYLMFVGGERYASELRGKFVDCGLVKNVENVNQAIKKLREKGFLKLVKIQKMERGPPAQIYTANLEPLIQSIGTLPRPSFLGFAGEETQRARSYLGTIHPLIFKYFLRYVSIERKHLHYALRNRSWDSIIQSLYGFLIMIGLDPVVKGLPMSRLLNWGIRFLAPMMFLPTDSMENNPALSSDIEKLKKEITENLSPSEKAFFDNLTLDAKKSWTNFDKVFKEMLGHE